MVIHCRSRLTSSPERMKCACGKTVLKSLYLTHCNSQVHQRFLQTGIPYEQVIDESYGVGDWRRYRFSKMRCLNNYFKRKRDRNKMFDNNIPILDK